MKKRLKDYYRKTHRLPEYDYSSPGAYFVTFNTKDREPILAKIANKCLKRTLYGEIVYEIWNLLPERYPGLSLDKISIMPDHVHALLWIDSSYGVKHVVRAVHEPPLLEQPLQLPPTNDMEKQKARRRMTIPKVVGYWKMNSAKRINQHRESIGNSVWQRDYFEEIIRDETHLFTVRKYIDFNMCNYSNNL